MTFTNYLIIPCSLCYVIHENLINCLY